MTGVPYPQAIITPRQANAGPLDIHHPVTLEEDGHQWEAPEELEDHLDPQDLLDRLGQETEMEDLVTIKLVVTHICSDPRPT